MSVKGVFSSAFGGEDVLGVWERERDSACPNNLIFPPPCAYCSLVMSSLKRFSEVYYSLLSKKKIEFVNVTVVEINSWPRWRKT